MQMSLINMHFIQIECKCEGFAYCPVDAGTVSSWTLPQLFLLNELRLMRLAWRQSPTHLHTGDLFCFPFTLLARSVCQSPWRKHGRAFNRGSCGLGWRNRNPYLFSFPGCSWSGCLVLIFYMLKRITSIMRPLRPLCRGFRVSSHGHSPQAKSQWHRKSGNNLPVARAFTFHLALRRRYVP